MAINWRERTTWVRAGWIATALWIIYVLEATKLDKAHPLFNYIFLVPLAGWMLALAIERLVRGRSAKTPPGKR